MVDITTDNYEPYFLDFAEGNLSESERHAVLQFVEYHPELKEDLEGFEVISVADGEVQSPNWNSLKKTEVDANEALYFKAVENDLTEKEKAAFDLLLKDETNQHDFKIWQQTRIESQGEEIGKSDLYQLGFELPIGQHNYEHFLIALGEGLLDLSQIKALKTYAGTQANGAQDLKYASALKLKPAKGIFYPDKKALYKKEKRIAIWWYRAAAIGVLLAFGAFLFNTLNQNPTKVQVAEQPKQVAPAQNTAPENEEVDSKEGSTQDDTAIQPVEKVTPKPVHEPVYHENIAENTPEPEVKKAPTNIEGEQKEKVPNGIDNPAPMDVLAAHPADTISVKTKQSPVEPLTYPTESIAAAEPHKSGTPTTFKTISQLAEDAIASRFEIKEDERDEMAMVLAKRVSDKAGEVLDSEMSRETSDNGDNTTYTFRFRNFKVQHTRTL